MMHLQGHIVYGETAFEITAKEKVHSCGVTSPKQYCEHGFALCYIICSIICIIFVHLPVIATAPPTLTLIVNNI